MNRSKRTIGRGAAIAVLCVAVLSTGCTTNPPPGGTTYTYEASSIRTTSFAPYFPPTFWQPDTNIQQPYLIHLGLRIRLQPTVSITTSVTSTYLNGGTTIGNIGPSQTLSIAPGDGLSFPGVKLPDFADLNNGVPFEILGSVEFLMERRQLIPLGLANVLQSVSALVNAVLPAILQNGGLPSDPGQLTDFLGQLLGNALAVLGGIVAAAIGSITGADRVVGTRIPLFLAAGGVLGSLLQGLLPGIINLVNVILAQQNPNPFPGGLPFSIDVVGSAPTQSYGTAPLTTYDVGYRWRAG